jgi:hypothetical protein
MSQTPRGRAEMARPRPPRSSPDATGDVVLVTLAPDESERLGLTAGQPLQVDRTRKPANGDLVWVEIVRHGSTQRLVRTYLFNDGWVTLTVPDDQTPAVMRRQGEILVLGVVVGAAPTPGAAEISPGDSSADPGERR